MTSKKPDFKKAYIKANEILIIAEDIVTFPFKVKKIIDRDPHIQMKNYDYARELGIEIPAFGSESAVIQKKGDRYIIFYNMNEIPERVKFSILHEYGHYYLKHRMENISKEEYDCNEVEANCFAAQILMPEQVLNELRRRGAPITKQYLAEHFGVSSSAAEKRLQTMGKLNYDWRSDEEKMDDETLMLKFGRFIDETIPKRSQYSWYEDEYELQKQRDAWDFDRRLRY